MKDKTVCCSLSFLVYNKICIQELSYSYITDTHTVNLDPYISFSQCGQMEGNAAVKVVFISISSVLYNISNVSQLSHFR